MSVVENKAIDRADTKITSPNLIHKKKSVPLHCTTAKAVGKDLSNSGSNQQNSR